MIPIATGRPGLIAIRHSTSEPTLFDAGLDVIFLAGRNPAAGQDQIMGVRRLAQASASEARSSRQDPEIADRAAEPRQHRHQHEAVGIEQLR